MRAARLRLYVNVDHIATLRQARRGAEPDPVVAALHCEAAGADGITAHLREDRRHIQDDDIRNLRSRVKSYFNLEIACIPAMIGMAIAVKPDQVTLVPERREEITTEGGLDLMSDPERVFGAVQSLQIAGIRTSLFIDPDVSAVARSKELGVEAIELHTGRYSHRDRDSLEQLKLAASAGAASGLSVHAGHGLTLENVAAVAAIPEIEELNIGHSIVANALSVGIGQAVRDMVTAIRKGRGA